MDRSLLGFWFRTDRGTIERAAWWRGTILLALPLLGLTAVWLAIAPGATPGFAPDAVFNPTMVFVVYVYLIVYAFALVLLAVSFYNLSAKRFRARHRAPAWAGVWPLLVLIAAAGHWLQPRLEGAMPLWSAYALDALAILVAVGLAVDLGWLEDNKLASN